MCDTIVVRLKDRVLFAKNSDRDPNEAQILDWHPAENHPEGSKVRCTWIEIPQIRRTHAVLLSRPFWMWGAEMGTNEHGVVIGNEAVFTNQPYATVGLTGMDLLRLALERSRSAREACEVLADLLETHGQGGGCGHENRRFTYHNSYLVADPGDAYVFETAGKRWAMEPVIGCRSISNGLTIPRFQRSFADPVKSRISACTTRQRRTQTLGDHARSPSDLAALLRDHGDGCANPHYAFINGGMRAVCMHAGGMIASAQTTASWISELTGDRLQHWATGTAAPCLGLFKPVSVRLPLDLTPIPADQADDSSGGGGMNACIGMRSRILRKSPLFLP
ncbi:MAG: C69 family dipeptidase [Planctomycetota bacterium]